MKNKIAIILPYFGKFPQWFSLFIEGCKYNDFIDFWIYTDNDYDECVCKNVFFRHMSFDEYCRKVGRALEIDFHPQSPYKLCGVRPFIGIVFEEELHGYDFWGFCDLDLVFGDLKMFFSPANLNKYDILSTEGDRIAGPLCIIKNNEEYRNKAFLIKHWQEMLMSENMVPVDEKYFSDVVTPELKPLRGIYRLILRKLFPLRGAKKINDMMSRPIWTLLAKRKRQLYKELNASPEMGLSDMDYVWEKGHVYERRTGEEIVYLHFLFFKKNIYRKLYLWNNNTKINTAGLDFTRPVFINENGIYN